MPQLMPLHWVFSSMMLFTMVVVMLLMYGMGYFGVPKINSLGGDITFFSLWW